MTMGEGGAVYTNNPLLNKCIRSFRDWGATASVHLVRTIFVDTALISSMENFRWDMIINMYILILDII